MAIAEVHLLVGRSQVGHGSELRARCGLKEKWKGKMPENFSAWQSSVTCVACGGSPKEQPQPVPAGRQGAKNATGPATAPQRQPEAAAPAGSLADQARQALRCSGLIRVTLSYACFGIVVDQDGVITEAAPIAGWSIGKTLLEFDDWVKSKGGSIQVLSR